MLATNKRHLVRIFIILCFSSIFINISNETQAQSFKEMSQLLSIDKICLDENRMSGGVVFFDYNDDNYFDLYIIGGTSSNVLYRNNWDGTFTNVSNEAGVDLPGITTVGAATGDIDNDGDDDLFVTTNVNLPNVLLRNNGDGTFTDISDQAGITHVSWSTSASFGDFNLDGLVDIYVNNYANFDAVPFSQNLLGGLPNFLYQNMGNNTFEEVASTVLVADEGCGLAVAFTDCDNDGDPDLYVANDFGYNFVPNELYINQYPEQKFEKTAASAGLDIGINAMGIAIGDYDEDRDLDYYITNIGDNPFFENLNNGGLFGNVGLTKQINNPDGTSWGTAFIDYNNDTYLDLIVANGEVIDAPHQNNENRLFKGDGNGNFVDVSMEAGIANNNTCRGLSHADFDNDGDLDIVFGVVAPSSDTEENILIYQNELDNELNWIKIKLQGINSNRNGFGTQFRVVIGDRSLIREADGGSSYLSQHANMTHVGLGEHQIIDSLIVDWPGKNRDIYLNVPVNKSITLVENSHWFSNVNQEIIINKVDSVLLEGAYQKEDGIYVDFLQGKSGKDSVRIVTRLEVDESLLVAVEEFENPLALGMKVFPNPVIDQAQLQYSLQKSSHVQILVYNLLGQSKEIFNNMQSPGSYELDINMTGIFGSNNNNELYLFRMIVDHKSYTIKAFKVDH